MVSIDYMGKSPYNLQLVFEKRPPQCHCTEVSVLHARSAWWEGEEWEKNQASLIWTALWPWNPPWEATGAPSCIKDCRSFWPGSISSISWTVFGSLPPPCLNRWWVPAQLPCIYQLGSCSGLEFHYHWCAFGGTSVQDPLKMLGFAGLYRLVLPKSNPFPRPCQSHVTIVST